MKKVIDAGALRSSALRDFLQASRSHFALITDYAAMEAFKGEGSVNIRRSLEIVAKFPSQALMLKPTGKIALLRPQEAGLRARLVDEKQTKNFRKYCALVAAGGYNPDLDADISQKEALSAAHFEVLEGQVEKIREGIHDMVRSYPLEDLCALRRRAPISESFSDRIINDILSITAKHFRSLGLNMPSVRDATYSFPFRYTLCCYLLTLRWITDGGHGNAASGKIRNDFTDMTYAAYATFYDGLLTKDGKLFELHGLAVWVLRNLAALLPSRPPRSS